MRYTHIAQSDLNLLASFQALVEERSITKAATRMFLSQPAMSRVLDRLQQMFKDELLVRTSNGYEVTRRALHIYAELERVLPRMERILCEEEFKPTEATDCFRIAATDHLVITLLPGLMEAVTQAGRGIQVEVSVWYEDVFQKLEANKLDLVLWVNQAPQGLHMAPLYVDEFVCLLRTAHPFAKRRLTLKRYLDQKHLVVSLAAGRQGLLEDALDQMGYRRSAQLKVPYFGAVPSIVERTDLIATLPKRLAERFSAISKTCVVSAPIKLPRLTHIQVWHPRNDADPAHRWLRAVIKKLSDEG